jgi:hypothetical protein
MKNVNKNRFLVARGIGGFMENPQIVYQDYRVIYAETKKQAEREYNTLDPNDMFKGTAVAGVIEEQLFYYIPDGLTIAMAERLKNYKYNTVFILFDSYPDGRGGRVQDFIGVYNNFGYVLRQCENLLDRYKKEPYTNLDGTINNDWEIKMVEDTQQQGLRYIKWLRRRDNFSWERILTVSEEIIKESFK